MGGMFHAGSEDIGHACACSWDVGVVSCRRLSLKEHRTRSSRSSELMSRWGHGMCSALKWLPARCWMRSRTPPAVQTRADVELLAQQRLVMILSAIGLRPTLARRQAEKTRRRDHPSGGKLSGANRIRRYQCLWPAIRTIIQAAERRSQARRRARRHPEFFFFEHPRKKKRKKEKRK